jgi:hypothetical protein
MFMRGATWSRDSHGLFDYESKNVTKHSLVASEGGRVTRVDNDIRVAAAAAEPMDLGSEERKESGCVGQELLQFKKIVTRSPISEGNKN